MSVRMLSLWFRFLALRHALLFFVILLLTRSRRHHAESSGNFVRLLWHPCSLHGDCAPWLAETASWKLHPQFCFRVAAREITKEDPSPRSTLRVARDINACLSVTGNLWVMIGTLLYVSGSYGRHSKLKNTEYILGFPTRMEYFIMLEIHHSGRKPSISRLRYTILAGNLNIMLEIHHSGREPSISCLRYTILAGNPRYHA